MRDYTKVPGYEGKTGPSARYNYLHDLMKEYKGLTTEDINNGVVCHRMKHSAADCLTCPFSVLLGGSPLICCNWRAEARPEHAISVLESLLEEPGEEEATAPRWEDSAKYIARHYGLAAQTPILQEECAELIQAVSKLRRAATCEVADAANEHLCEEIADVTIMLEQIQFLTQSYDRVAQIRDAKLARQIERIEKERAR